MLFPLRDGNIPGISYGLSIADNMNGPRYQASGYTFYSDWDKYSYPPRCGMDV
ncbi:MAG TPA: hypothetical protein VFC65_08790 [Prolixibacteraceae bacterium]|nr:hypothetical protein [Prolixibacteraceae bacterium]